MKRPPIWMVIVAGLLCGLAGYVLGARVHASSRSTVPASSPGADTTRAAPADAQAPRERPSGGTGAPGDCAETGTLQAENTELRERIERLRQAVDVERALRQQTEGTAIPFPAQIDEKYTGPRLQAAIEDSLKALALDGDVNAMDCSEFPCIAHGELRSDEGIEVAQQELLRLHEEARQRYPGAEFYVSQSAWVGEDGVPVLLFSMTYYDRPASGIEELERRMRYRKNQFFDAFMGK